MSALSTGIAEACPACGAPAEMYQDEFSRKTFARCHGCDSAWVPLDEWNSDRLAVSEIPPARALFEKSSTRLAMVAKEGSPVWGEFRREVEELAPTAKAIVVTSVDQKEAMRLARIHRLKLRDIRLDLVKTHKDEKAESLAKGQALDAAKRELLAVIEPLEQHLLEQEEFEKRTLAAQTEARQRAREEILRGFVDNPETLQLSEMTQADFIALCDFHEARWYAKRDAEVKAVAEEAARVQREADEREAQRAEVERLRAEAAEKERALAAERALVEQQRRVAFAESRAKQEAIEKKAREEKAAIEAAAAKERQQQAAKAAEAEKARQAAEAAHQAALAAERERQRKELEAAAIEREQVAAIARAEQARLQAIADAAALEARTIREAKEAADAEIARQRQAEQAAADAASKAPDREKLLAFAALVDGLEIPSVKARDADGIAIYRLLTMDRNDFAARVRSRAESL